MDQLYASYARKLIFEDEFSRGFSHIFLHSQFTTLRKIQDMLGFFWDLILAATKLLLEIHCLKKIKSNKIWRKVN